MTVTSFEQLATVPAVREAREIEHLRASVASAVIRGAPLHRLQRGLRVVPQHFQQDPVVQAFLWLVSPN